MFYQTIVVGLLAHQEGHSSHPLTYKCPLSSQISLSHFRSAPFPGTLLTCHYLSRTKLHKSQPQISPYTSPYISTILDLSRMFIIISIVFIDPLCLHLGNYSGFVPRLPSKLRLLLRSRSRRESGISCSSSPESSASRCISSKDDPAGAADGAKSAEGAPAGASK